MVSKIPPPPTTTKLLDDKGYMSKPWTEWLRIVADTLNKVGA